MRRVGTTARQVIAAATGAAAVAAFVTSRRATSGRAAGPTRPRTTVAGRSRAARLFRLSNLGARSVARRSWLAIRSKGASPERRRTLEERFTIRTAEDVADQLGQMRGVMMKLGQLAGIVAEGLPDQAREAFESLQQSAPAMDPALAAAVVTTDLGQRPERLFQTWDPMPIAAASIGQVHRATSVAGRDLAVKVQYPGVADAIAADLSNTALLHTLLKGWFAGLDSEPLVEEMRQRIGEELDYRIEATNQREFATMFEHHPWVRIPTIIDGLSSAHVLTSTWADGLRFEEFASVVDDHDKSRAAEIIWRFAQHSIHRHRVFNGDPHPGNFRFHRDGTVTFLDFGLTKRWSVEEWASLKYTLDAVVLDGSDEAIVEAMRTSGFLARDAIVDHRDLVEYVRAPYTPYLVDEFEFTAAWLQRTVRTATGRDHAATMRVLNIPPSFLFLNRIVWALSGVLTKLGASGPYRAMLLEYLIDADPATELGRSEADWRTLTAARRGH